MHLIILLIKKIWRHQCQFAFLPPYSTGPILHDKIYFWNEKLKIKESLGFIPGKLSKSVCKRENLATVSSIFLENVNFLLRLLFISISVCRLIWSLNLVFVITITEWFNQPTCSVYCFNMMRPAAISDYYKELIILSSDWNFVSIWTLKNNSCSLTK